MTIDYETLDRAAQVLNAVPVPEKGRKVLFPTREQYENFCLFCGIQPDTSIEFVQTEPIILES